MQSKSLHIDQKRNNFKSNVRLIAPKIKNIFNMNKQSTQKIMPSRYLFIPPPPSGYVNELKSLFNVSKNTVRYALQGNTFSRKAEEIRREYYNRYIKPYIEEYYNGPH